MAAAASAELTNSTNATGPLTPPAPVSSRSRENPAQLSLLHTCPQSYRLQRYHRSREPDRSIDRKIASRSQALRGTVSDGRHESDQKWFRPVPCAFRTFFDHAIQIPI
ncbi:unnamed protein product [Leptidea sinapis]|uniref:Uncharacterized protein n=1 Tax=Leptidea sinapis TaxID=189913 RepID=A0A5E4QJD0_9NEOP|nr:unnamed protein product [Leptidea sinapis]